MALITYLTTIKFGFGEIAGIEADLAALGVAKPLIVTDRGIVAAGLIDAIGQNAGRLKEAPVFSDTPTNPTEEAVEAALACYRRHGCDGIVAIGGGSPIDLAKGVALLATHNEPLERLAAIHGGIARITPAVSPVIPPLSPVSSPSWKQEVRSEGEPAGGQQPGGEETKEGNE